MSEVKNLGLRDIHLAFPWAKGPIGRILQVRGSGGGGPGIPAETIATGMHVRIEDEIHAILLLSGAHAGEMLSSTYWNDAALDVTGEVEIVAAAGVAPMAPKSGHQMTLGALYRHKEEAAFFVQAELDGSSRAFGGLVCVASWTDKWMVGTAHRGLRNVDFAFVAAKVGLSNDEAVLSKLMRAEAAE
jgi:hypothetical protein